LCLAKESKGAKLKAELKSGPDGAGAASVVGRRKMVIFDRDPKKAND
jgi:hypothetical protein